MADLVGMHFKEFESPLPTTVITSDRDHPLVNALPVGLRLRAVPAPAAALAASAARTRTRSSRASSPSRRCSRWTTRRPLSLGYYPFDELPAPVATSRRRRPSPSGTTTTRYVGFAAKHGQDWTSVYAGVVAWSSDSWRWARGGRRRGSSPGRARQGRPRRRGARPGGRGGRSDSASEPPKRERRRRRGNCPNPKPTGSAFTNWMVAVGGDDRGGQGDIELLEVHADEVGHVVHGGGHLRIVIEEPRGVVEEEHVAIAAETLDRATLGLGGRGRC